MLTKLFLTMTFGAFTTLAAKCVSGVDAGTGTCGICSYRKSNLLRFPGSRITKAFSYCRDCCRCSKNDCHNTYEQAGKKFVTYRGQRHGNDIDFYCGSHWDGSCFHCGWLFLWNGLKTLHGCKGGVTAVGCIACLHALQAHQPKGYVAQCSGCQDWWAIRKG